MKTIQRWTWLWLVGLLVGGWMLGAQALPQRSGYVNDEAGVLSTKVLAENEAFLAEHEKQTGEALYVLIVSNLEGSDVEDYDKQIAAGWELGEQHVLLLIAIEDAIVHLSAGGTLKTTYSDERLSAVVQAIVPYLVLKNFDQAISTGIERLVHPALEPLRHKATQGWLQGPLRLVLIAGVAALSAALFFLFRA